MIPDIEQDSKILIEAADRAMYRAKELGRNRAMTFSAALVDDPLESKNRISSQKAEPEQALEAPQRGD